MKEYIVEITKNIEPPAWYANGVGEQFNVYWRGRDYVLAEDYDVGGYAPWRHIEPSDCKIVKEL